MRRNAGGPEEKARPQQTSARETGTPVLQVQGPGFCRQPEQLRTWILPKASAKTLMLAHETLSGAQASPMPDSPPEETVTDKRVLF